MKKAFTLAVLLLTGLALPACTSAAPPPTATAAPTLSVADTAAPAPLATSTHRAAQVPAPPQEAPVLTATREPPVRFTFPTPLPVASPLWRPPQYDAPWAMSPQDHFYFNRPIAVDEINWPIQDYRYGGLAEGMRLAHSGVDISAPRGTPVLAAAAGRVMWVGYGLITGQHDPDDPYGLAVTVDHDFGYNGYRLNTVYAHLDSVDVNPGDRVEVGQRVGVLGATGLATGPHLHFEVRLKIGTYYSSRNPELWLAPAQGWGVLVGRLVKEDNSPLYQLAVDIRDLNSRRTWQVFSYGPNNTHADDFYKENLVISDLPAGDYKLSFEIDEVTKSHTFTIRPGAVTYFSYRDGRGFSTDLPKLQAQDWLVTPRAP